MVEGSGLALAILLRPLAAEAPDGRRRSIRIEADSLRSIEPDGSPGQRLIASSEAVRGALIEAFGPAWGSKTTEEIGDDPALLERIDPDQVERLVAFLKGADRAKFASVEPDSLEDWEAWAASFVSDARGRRDLEEQREVIRADRRAEPPARDRQVWREEGVVNRDPVGRPGRPAPLPAEAEAAVAQTRLIEEPAEVGRAVGAIEVADHQGRSAFTPDPVGQVIELLARGQAIGPSAAARRDGRARDVVVSPRNRRPRGSRACRKGAVSADIRASSAGP